MRAHEQVHTQGEDVLMRYSWYCVDGEGPGFLEDRRKDAAKLEQQRRQALDCPKEAYPPLVLHVSGDVVLAVHEGRHKCAVLLHP